MINQEFNFPKDQIHYYIGIGALKTNQLEFETIFNLIELIQNQFENTTLQFFNKKLILNYNHIFYAAYHTLKTFQLETNISNKMGIEFLLYLAVNRQIKRALKYFGITNHQINQNTLNFCIISMNSNLKIILKEIIEQIKAKEGLLDLTNSYSKFVKIKNYFRINDNQIKTVLKSYKVNVDNVKINQINIKDLYLALEDLICEKMVLLRLEKSIND